MSEIIYSNPVGNGLGDVWAVAQALLHISVDSDTPVRLCRISAPTHLGAIDQWDIFSRVLAQIDSPGTVALTMEKGTHDVPQNLTWNQAKKYFPTKKKWVGDRKQIAYQFDGRSSAGEKNPPEADLERLLSWAPGYTFVRLGLPLTLEESIEVLTHSRMFIGICSGQSHLAHSVGLPMLLVQYKMEVTWWHGHNPFTLAHGTDAAIDAAKKMLSLTPPTDPVYRAHHTHLGDCFVTINFMAHMGRPVRLSRWQQGEDLGGMMQSIINVLDIPPGSVTVVDDQATEGFNAVEAWRQDYFPTKRRWKPGPHLRVCYQFDGRCIPEDKNPPADQLEQLLADWLPKGYQFVRLGLPLTIAQDVEILATSDAFVGVCSGLSHICHAVGTPCFLLEYKLPLAQAHFGKIYQTCHSAAEMIAKVLTFLGHPTPFESVVPAVPEQPMSARDRDRQKLAAALPRLRPSKDV